MTCASFSEFIASHNPRPRGVYVADWYLGRPGDFLAFAVDSRGVHLGQRVFYDQVGWDIAERVLTEILDRNDPLPALQLIS